MTARREEAVKEGGGGELEEFEKSWKGTGARDGRYGMQKTRKMAEFTYPCGFRKLS